LGLVADLVVDVAVAEQAAALLLPLPLAETALHAALAIAETAAYLGVHLKYLHAWDEGDRCQKPISPQMPRYFKFFHTPEPPRGGGHACSRASVVACVGHGVHLAESLGWGCSSAYSTCSIRNDSRPPSSSGSR